MHFNVHDPAAANRRRHPPKLKGRRGPRTARKKKQNPTLAQGLRLTRGRRRRVGRRRVCSPNSSPGCRPASIPGQEKLQGHSQLDLQNYSARSRDRGRARRGRIPQGHGAHANFSASRSFACALCSGRQREKPPSWAGNLNARRRCGAAALVCVASSYLGTCGGSTAS